jgi:hypothetical protein
MGPSIKKKEKKKEEIASNNAGPNAPRRGSWEFLHPPKIVLSSRL